MERARYADEYDVYCILGDMKWITVYNFIDLPTVRREQKKSKVINNSQYR